MLRSLRRQVHEVITDCVAPAIREDMVRLLGRPGYALHPAGPCRAGLLALKVHEAVNRKPFALSALHAAVAVELQMEAAFVFDEVADKAPYVTRSEDLALAIALLTTGMAAAEKAATGAPDPVGALQHFCTAYNEACAGQFLDAMLQRRGAATLDEALEATRLKSGGLGKFVTGFAARVAGADPRTVTMLERFGFHTFTFAQLVDDLRDACVGGGGASDLSQGKATLPVVFSCQSVDSVPCDSGMLACEVPAYIASGAPVYVAIVAQAYMSRAKEDLALLFREGHPIGGLARFLESLDSEASDTLTAARAGLVS